MNVTVVYGGKSGEHEISLVSAAAVARNIDRNHDITLIAITKTGRWFLQPQEELERIRASETASFEIIEDEKCEVFAVPGGGTALRRMQPPGFCRYHGQGKDKGGACGCRNSCGAGYLRKEKRYCRLEKIR